MGTRALLIYEGDCGFCSRAARFIARRMPTDAVIKPWQRVDLQAYGLSRERARYELLWVAPGGKVDGGAQAVARLLLDCGGLWAVPGGLLRLPPMRWIGHGLYRLVARNRQHLPGGGPACGIKPRAERPDAA